MLVPLLIALIDPTVAISAPPVRYRIEMSTTTEQDLTALGAGKQNATLGVVALVTVTLSDTVGGQIAHVVVDSMALQGDAAMLAPQTDGPLPPPAKGAFWHIYLKNGRLSSAPLPSAKLLGMTLATNGVVSLFAPVRSPLKLGDKWTDTTTMSLDTLGVKTEERSVTEWSVDGTEAGAFILNGRSHGTSTVNGPQTVSAMAERTITVVTSGSGLANRTSQTVSTSTTMTAPQFPAPIPGTATGKITVTKL